MWDTRETSILTPLRAPLPHAPVWSFPMLHFFPPFEVGEFMGSRSTSLEDRENFPEGPIAPFHHSTDMGDLGGRTKSVIPYPCEDPQIPQSINALQYLGV